VTADPRERQLKAVQRLLAAKESRDSLLSYLQFTNPDRADPEDATRSSYIITPQARLLCEIVEKCERGELKRAAVSIGPQFGKSEIISRKGPAWIAGRNPHRHMILGSYNTDFANEFGFEVRNIAQSPQHRQVFPDFQFLKGGGKTDLLITKENGKLAFVGVGGSGSGKPADGFIVDDPYRNHEDANSESYREKVWRWFNGVVQARAHDNTWIILVHTRWNLDDLIGRLCDPNHPERNGLYRGLEKRWTHINLPAVVEDPNLAKALGLTLEPQKDPDVLEQFGTKPMSALWPGRKSLPLLAEVKQSDAYTFNSLYMGSPAPDEGEYFKKDYIVEYDARDLPPLLRKYGASDHAVSSKQRRDFTVLGCVGIDEKDDIWVMPDVVFRRMQTDVTVEELINQFETHKPGLWWMEDELISKSFGPFLIKRMHERKVYTTTLDPVRPSKDKETRARAIQGRMAMRKVHLPKFAPWYQRARGQLLTFPYGGANADDFVDWLSLIGHGLNKELKPATAKNDDERPPSNSIGAILKSAKLRAAREAASKATAGW
jgi:predicted phage terminase large subunit-like protein